MNETSVRLEKISIQGLKNVMDGHIDLRNPRKPFQANILGLYGQNGSGKTALIDAIELLRLAVCGSQIPAKFADFIHVDASCAALEYQFAIQKQDETYRVCYAFRMQKVVEPHLANTGLEDPDGDECRVLILDETLRYSFASDHDRSPMGRLIDTKTADVFVPAAKYKCLIGTEEDVRMDLLVAKKMAAATSRSFIFSKELLQALRKRRESADESLKKHLFVIERLVAFGNFELFVINTTNSGLIAMDALPLAFKYEEKNIGAAGSLMVRLEGTTTYPLEMLDIIKKVIRNMNVVLSQVIPGLTVGVRELGQQLLKNGKTGVQIQLVSCRNEKEIALRYESEGIKKIISVLHLLIGVYNRASITVAIDELDAGIFEYLLGEILRVVSEKGKGQLIFTSHNLRPLETLDRGYIAFTTTNPDHRYIRMTNVKPNHNLRDFYYRDIMLGEQSEPVYDPTNNYEIALAFREAGELHGS